MEFIRQYAEHLAAVTDEIALEELHHWVARESGGRLGPEIEALTEALRLTDGCRQLHDDLPCLTVGSRRGLVLLSANPGWDSKVSRQLRVMYAKDPSSYWSLASDYFRDLPDDLRNRWWYKAFPYLELIPESGYQRQKGAAAWQLAHACKMFGGWELIPFASSRDGVTPRIHQSPELTALASASVKAVLALKPRLLLVGQKQACKLIEDLEARHWTIRSLPGNVTLKYHRYDEDKEIVLIPRQFISDRFQALKRIHVVEAVGRLRETWPRD